MREQDIRWCFAATRLGALPAVHDRMPERASPHEFREAFEDWLQAHDYAWMLHAPCGDERRPVGLATGMDMPYPVAGLFGIAWFPWATARRRLEAAAALFNTLRREAVMVIPSAQNDVRFFTHMARYGVLRRIGTLHDVGDEPVALFQTRRPGI